MESATKFMEMYNEAENAFRTSETSSRSRIAMISDARKVYNNSYGETIKSKFNTKSMYVSPEGMVIPDLFAEAVIARIPSFSYKTSKEYAVRAKNNLNNVVKDAISAHRLDSKILPIAIAGFRDGIGVFEVYPKKIVKSGWMIGTKEEGGNMQEYNTDLGMGLEIRRYDVILDEVLIDPLADPVDVAGTARYVIVKWGDFSIEQIEQMAEEKKGQKGWDIEPNKLFASRHSMTEARDALLDEGLLKPDSVTIHKVFYPDGTIDYVAGKQYVIGSRIINSKFIKEMPLIIYTPIPGGGTPYGRSVWDLIRHAVDIKSGCVNLSADNTAKNITASIVTDSSYLAEETDAYSLASNKILHIEPGDRPVRDRITQIQWVDMTVGLQFLHGISAGDLQKITKISDLTLGAPGFSPRTNGVVDAMQSGSVSNISMFLKQTEDTLFQPLAKHILDILYNFYPEFELGVERELLNVSNIRVQKGTSLEGAQGMQLQLLQAALSYAMQMPMDWDVLGVLTAYFKEAGLPEIETFLATPEEAMMKQLMAMQIPQQQAQAVIQQVQQLAQRQQQQGGGQPQ
jgi:hypothetical protein